MKYLFIILQLFLVSTSLFSQNIIYDSLCYNISNDTRIRLPISTIYKYKNESKPEYQYYYGENRKNIYHSKYRIMDLSWKFLIMFGVELDMYDAGRDAVSVNGDCSFFNGVPCCQWTLENSWRNGEMWGSTIRIFNFNEGFLHGNYSVISSKGDTLYTTTFENGTGYYKEYYPDGKILQEGQVVNGRKEGVWFLNNRKDWVAFIKYENGFKRSKESFYSEEYLDDYVRRAIEWERQSAELKEGQENPWLE